MDDSLKGIFTFAATIVGAGILALPVLLGAIGFFPGTVMIIFIGLACILSAFFIIESFLRTGENLHLPGLAKKYLGKWGSALMLLGIIIYIYGALVGYLSAGGQVIHEFSKGKIPIQAGMMIYFFIGTLIIYFGIRAVKITSTVLFSLMLVLFLVIIFYAFPHLNFSSLQFADWGKMPTVFGILLFAFTGHTILPSLAQALEGRKTTIKKIGFFGIILPLIMYIIWFFIILSVVPYGETLFPKDTDFLSTATLSEARELGQPATIPLAHLIGGQILILAVLFTLFSTFTSFLGFGISLQDSFFDLKFKKISALVLAVLPPLFFSFWHPTSFLKSLDFAGLYGAGLFVGILPALMVLKARKRGDRAPEFVIFGKSIIPWFVFFIFVFGLIYNTAYSFF